MSDSIKKRLVEYIKEKNFFQYNDILRNEIIKFYVNKMQEKRQSFMYSTLPELLENVEQNLETDDINNFRYFYDLFKKDYEPIVLAKHLTEVYGKIFV